MPGAGGEAQTTVTQREGVQNTLPALPSVDELFRNVPDALPIAFHPRHAALTTLRPNVGCAIPSVHQGVNSVRPDEHQRVPNTQVHSHQPTLNEHIGGVPHHANDCTGNNHPVPHQRILHPVPEAHVPAPLPGLNKLVIGGMLYLAIVLMRPNRPSNRTWVAECPTLTAMTMQPCPGSIKVYSKFNQLHISLPPRPPNTRRTRLSVSPFR